jgi:hypothetical protein
MDSMITVYTTGPEAADYRYTRTEECFEHLGEEWRKVVIRADRYRLGYQCDRYRSFWMGRAFLTDPRQDDVQTEAPSNFSP